MRYLLTGAGNGYEEESVSWLYEERHLYGRGENIAISSGEEAVLWIAGMKSRFYIRGMQIFYEVSMGEELYRNGQQVISGNDLLYPGDTLFLGNVKLEIWEEQVAVWGECKDYNTSLPEMLPKRKPKGFPVYERSPRLIRKPSEDKILFEFPKEKETHNKKELLMVILPPLGMALATMLVGLLAGQGIYLFLAVIGAGMTAVFSGIKYMNDRMERRERNRRYEKQYIEYLWCKQREIGISYEREQAVYSYQYPDIEKLCRMVQGYDSRIYERLASDEDFLAASVGHYAGKTAFTVEGKEPAWSEEEDPLVKIGRKIRRRYSVVDRPKAIDLKKAHLGIVGSKELVHRQLKMLAVQMAFFHSYQDLQMVVIYDRKYEEEFAWMRWLPHLRIRAMNVCGMVSSKRTRDLVLGSLQQILKERAVYREKGKRESRYLPHYLFLIEEPSWIFNHGIMEYLHMDGNMLGFSVIYTTYARANLPEYIGTVLLLNHSKEGMLLTEEREYLEQRICLYDDKNIDFEWMARDLSVLDHEQRITSHIPEQITFFELYGIRHPREFDAPRRWRTHHSYKSLAVPVGLRSADEALYLNLHEKAHGPHGLVAGTTGSGKSELIQSYILSLAVNFHPYEVGFLLIDYKGGGMANLFRELPHHLGTITNLDGSGSMRALVSVKAELARRQKIFGKYQVNHINGYMKLFHTGEAREPVPHLFIISDEFAELKKEQPEFMKELVSAARIGRSLGVHLILATQKPAGVVDEQILSNSRFRLCLKVQNESDSKEVLGTMDAAGITIPGRAYLKVGNNEIYELFQSALSKAAYKERKEDAADERIYVVNELGQGELVNEDLSSREEEYRAGKTQLEATIEYLREIAARECCLKVKRPWMPPLENMIVSPYGVEYGEPGGCRGEGGRPGVGKTDGGSKAGCCICIGKIDIPETQEQRELKYCPVKDGNLLFVASAGFGKTVFLTTILTSLAAVYDVDILNFYILDYGNSGCMPMKELPHTAEYITVDDDERYQKFKKRITKEIADRKKLFARYAVSSLEAYQEISGKRMKILLVAVDQFDVVKETGIEEEEFFTRLTRDGMALGIYTVAASARISAVRQATLNNFKNKIAGYNFDENETFLTVGRTAHRQTDIKGRVLMGGETVHEAQIYIMAECEEQTLYDKALKALIQKIRRKYPGKEAPHIPVLPQELSSHLLKEYPGDGSDYLVGLDIEDVTGKGFGKEAGLFVIVGNTGTGKTNILRVLARQAADSGKTYLFDSKSMELYSYRQTPDVLYVDGEKERAAFIREISEEWKARRRILREQLKKYPDISPKKLIGSMSYCSILIDDLDDFTEFMKDDLNQAALLIKEGAALGIVCIVTVHAAKARGIGELDRMVKQAANGLVLGPQGIIPIFPVSSMRENPKFGDGLLFKNGVYTRVRLPKYVQGKEEEDGRQNSY